MSRAQLTSTVEQNTGGAVAPFVAGKNVIINGGMDIWQRNTTSSSYGAYATADRWYIAGGGSFTSNQDTDVPSGVAVQYSLNWTTTAGSSFGQFYQGIEQGVVKTLRGQTVTASAWFKTAGSFAGNLIFRFDYSTSTDAVVSVTTNIAGTDVTFAGSSATSWVKKTSTFVVPSNAVGLRVSLVPDTVQSSGVTAKMTGVQLELGSVATPFSRAGGTLQGELAACQRYYWRQNADSTLNAVHFGFGTAYSTTAILAGIALPVSMRTTPTVLDYSAINAWDGSSTLTGSSPGISGNRSNPQYVQLNLTVSGATQFRPYFILANSSSSYLGVSAEL
jgi:hypothetical protein